MAVVGAQTIEGAFELVAAVLDAELVQQVQSIYEFEIAGKVGLPAPPRSRSDGH